MNQLPKIESNLINWLEEYLERQRNKVIDFIGPILIDINIDVIIITSALFNGNLYFLKSFKAWRAHITGTINLHYFWLTLTWKPLSYEGKK